MEKHPVQLFAEQNAGKSGALNLPLSSRNGFRLTILGWTKWNRMPFEAEDVKYKVIVSFNGFEARDVHYHTYVSNSTYWVYTGRINTALYYYNIDDIKLDTEKPDDCLECGAKGEEVCKDWCRNK